VIEVPSRNLLASVRIKGAAISVVLGLLAFAGCAREPATPGDAFQQRVDEAIELAERADASQAQLDALEAAKLAGVLTVELARQQTNAAIACMTAAGVVAHYDERTKPGGVVVPIYIAEISPDSPVGDDGVSRDERVAEQCDSREAFYVNKLFLTQPASVEAKQAEIEERAPEIRACLENGGYPPAEDATATELDAQSLEVYKQTEGEVNCVIGLGL